MVNKINRRSFIKASMGATSALLIARAAHAQEILAEDDGTAVAMGYQANHANVDASVWSKKAGADGDQQQCTSCALYQSIDDAYGLCPIFAGKRVHAAGWCNGWIAK